MHTVLHARKQVGWHAKPWRSLDLCTPCAPRHSQIQVLTRRRTDVAPPDPNTPRMLPSVHLAWAPLMGALQVRTACHCSHA